MVQRVDIGGGGRVGRGGRVGGGGGAEGGRFPPLSCFTPEFSCDATFFVC